MNEATTLINLTSGVLQLNVDGAPPLFLAKGGTKTFTTLGELSVYEKQISNLVAANWLGVVSGETTSVVAETPTVEKVRNRGRPPKEFKE